MPTEPTESRRERQQALATQAEALAHKILTRPAMTLHPDTIALARLVLALAQEVLA
jgi:hypothetical protein